MSFQTGHSKTICSECNVVIMQCRCMENHAHITYSLCEECSNKIKNNKKIEIMSEEWSKEFREDHSRHQEMVGPKYSFDENYLLANSMGYRSGWMARQLKVSQLYRKIDELEKKLNVALDFLQDLAGENEYAAEVLSKIKGEE